MVVDQKSYDRRQDEREDCRERERRQHLAAEDESRNRSAVTIRNAARSLVELDAIGIRAPSFSTDRIRSATKRWPLANSPHLRSFLPAVKPPISASATSCIGVMSRASRIAASSVDC